MTEYLTVQKLAEKLALKIDRHYTQDSLHAKIFKSSLRFDEMEEIADLLGYEIRIEKKS